MKRKLLCSNKIGLQTRKQHVKTFQWSMALYGSEAWAIGKIDQKRPSKPGTGGGRSRSNGRKIQLEKNTSGANIEESISQEIPGNKAISSGSGRMEGCSQPIQGLDDRR
jgi:hypothetical protein